ncbi:putative low molecular weight protein antigen 6 [Corynebacterium renale]|nr:putative low molecular weight protein antigen 6 [Corynebacterium renale]
MFPMSSPTTLRPDRTHLLVAAVMTCIMLIPIGSAPLVLGWLIIVPILYFWWIQKTATIIDDSGITAQYAFRGNKQVPWDELAGIGFKGATTFASTHAGENITLPAVTFNSLPVLSEASDGRIPDALTQSREAIDDMVRIVNKDGREVLVTREEYARIHAHDKDPLVQRSDADDTANDA